MSVAQTAAADAVRVELAVEGMTCASCVARVERKLQRVPGVGASVNLATERASVTAPSGVATEDLIRAVEQAGYSARVIPAEREAGDEAYEEDASSARLVPRLIVAAVLSLPVALLSMVPALRFPGSEIVAMVLTLPVVLWAGWPFHRAAAVALRHGSATMDTLVSLGTLAALGWSTVVALTGADAHQYFEVAAVVTTFILIGRVIEQRSRRRAGAALRSLLEAGGREATRRTSGGGEHLVPVAALAPGDLVVVRPGERIPVDGVVEEGAAGVDVSALTGESLPVEAVPGAEVAAGTIALGGALAVRATRVGTDTRLARIGALVEAAQLGKTRSQRLADRISGVFVPVVIALALVTFFAWLWATGSAATALQPAIAVLIVACPCALGLATPIALLVGTTRAAQRGVLISGAEALETAGRIDTVVFDKTGTLTTGRMAVLGVTPAPGEDAARALSLAASAERGSEHPVGRAIAAASPDATAARADGFRSVAGLGVTAVVAGEEVAVARTDGPLGPELDAAVASYRSDGLTVVVVRIDGVARAVIGVGDPLRVEAAEAVRRVRGLGAETIVLSGDHPDTVSAVLRPLTGGVPGERLPFVGGASPESKAQEVRRLRDEGRRVAMVGDGINDAAALAVSDLGIALASGSDIAMEAGDVTLLRPDPRLVADAISLSRRMLGVIRGNLFWAFAYNVAALPVAALGLLDPMIAGAAMAFSSVFVVLNSLRLRRF
ncbi:heavy metal translocating P-type ATPase [Leifsonia sp. AG29]|uniref:heavy metal translocating P-type ATPase n=1 Tax=Leifsonia sp. AG29 TaxID=2598860 RepID=UPI0022799256|nr:cation-translocating P-type ATPase [Leifsonia sp. AG29]